MASVEDAPRCILMWRSFTHWIGGMGVLVLLLSIIKMSGGSQMNLMKAESPGSSVSRPGTYRTFYGKDSVYDLSSDDGAGDCDSAVMWNAGI